MINLLVILLSLLSQLETVTLADLDSLAVVKDVEKRSQALLDLGRRIGRNRKQIEENDLERLVDRFQNEVMKVANPEGVSWQLFDEAIALGQLAKRSRHSSHLRSLKIASMAHQAKANPKVEWVSDYLGFATEEADRAVGNKDVLRALELLSQAWDVAVRSKASDKRLPVGIRLAAYSFRAKQFERALIVYTQIESLPELNATDRVQVGVNKAETARVIGKIGLAIASLDSTRKILADVDEADLNYANHRILKVSSRVLKSAGRFREARINASSAISRMRETGYGTVDYPELSQIQAECLLVEGRCVEAIQVARQRKSLIDAATIRGGNSNSLESIQASILLASILSQSGLSATSHEMLKDALADCRPLIAGRVRDDLLLSTLVKLSSNSNTTLEEQILFSLEGLKVRERLEGPNSLTVLSGHIDLARLYEAQGETQLHREICARVRVRLEELAKSDESQFVVYALMYCMVSTGDFADALNLIRNKVPEDLANQSIRPEKWFVAIAEHSLRKGQIETATIMADKALARQKQLAKQLGSGIPGHEIYGGIAGVLLRLGGDIQNNRKVLDCLWLLSSEARLSTRAQSQRTENETKELPSISGVQSRLTESDVLAQYAAYDPGDGVPRLCLLVVTKDRVARHDLGKRWRFREAARAWGNRIRTGRDDEAQAKQVGEMLGLTHLQLPQRSRVFLAASPLVEQIPFAALVDEEGKRVVERAAVISTSALAFQINEQPPKAADTMLLVGDVDYGAPRKDGQFRLSWKPLPASKLELDAIGSLAEERKLKVRELRGRKATKQEVLQRAKKARVIHLATHAAVFKSGVTEWRPVTEPFKLTGVTLAGANERGPESILSGAETCLLDLRAADLVVLAGCETHIGLPFADSTSASLAQAYHVAGARNVVASFWQVDDKATAAFMRLMYSNLWAKQQPIHEAVRHAQLTLYRNPELIQDLAGSRGPDFERVEQKAAKPKVAGGRRTPTRLWGAFQLSGVGGLATAP